MATKNKANIITDITNGILTGGRLTTASNVRGVLNTILDSYPNVVDGGMIFQQDVGYAGGTPYTPSNSNAFATKGYVDGLVGTGYSANNGITLSGTTFQFGGLLTAGTQIKGAGTYALELGTTLSPLTDGKINANSEGLLSVVNGVNQHYFSASNANNHARIYSTAEIHGTAPKYLFETTSTNHYIQAEDGAGIRLSANAGNGDIFINELTNEIYAYSTTRFTVDAPLFRTTATNTEIDFSTDNGAYLTPYLYMNNSTNVWQIGNSLANIDVTGGTASYTATTATFAGTTLNLNTTNVKVGAITASRALYLDASNYIQSSSVTDTELGYLSGVTSSIQTQLNGKIDGTIPATAGLIPYGTGTADTVTTTSGFSFDGTNLSVAGAFTGNEPNSTATNRGYTINTRDVAVTYPVPAFRPTTNNTVMAVDIMPKGSPAEIAGNGFAWLDVCDADVLTGSAAVRCARVGVLSTGIEFGTRVFNGGTSLPMLFTINGTTFMTGTTAGKVMMGTKTGAANWNLDVHQASAAACIIGFSNTNTGTASTDGFNIGIAADGAALLLQRENLGIEFWTNATKQWSVSSGGVLTAEDAKNIAFGTTTGTKIGTATTQKLGFWNATPVVQQTTASAAATFAANTSGIADDTATFDSYTIGQVVKILRTIGILA